MDPRDQTSDPAGSPAFPLFSAWREVVPASEQEIYVKAGFGQPAGLGDSPAVLVIDVQYRTVGEEPLPIAESIERHYRTSCGEQGWNAIAVMIPILAAARRAGVPVVYPHVAPKGSLDVGRTGTKIPALMEVPSKGYEFVAEVAPREGDLLVPKRHASAFFGTSLVSHLIDLGVDSVILLGCTTSGCIRASAVDAFSYNFHCVVAEDAVYDRSPTSHAVNLFDLQAKYADVLPGERVAAHLDAIADRETAA
jgi:maleamate amidohydrolase